MKPLFSSDSNFELKVVPDEHDLIRNALLEFCSADFDLVLTTGGTGFAVRTKQPRDITPEVTRTVIEREAPGLTTMLITRSLAKTPLAVLSRAVAGTRGRT